MNPFYETIVSNPWDTTVCDSDVPTIHENVFEACLNGIEQVRATRHSGALLLHGAAGSGKTHLLRRLRAKLAIKLASATDRDETLFVWVRLQTCPRMIWRTVRRNLVNDWFRPISESRCQFDRILFRRLAEIRIAEGDLEPWYEYILQEDPEGLKRLIEQIAEKLDLDRNTHLAFEHLAFGRHRRDLRAWLCGDSLPEAALDRMELTQDEGTDEEREDQASQVVLMLCRLAGDALPIVLSFDQVEALETDPGAKDALFAFGQMISTLHDSTTNVLVISSVQSAFADRLQQEARAADRDRMRSLGAYSIHPLQRAEAQELIFARLSGLDDLSTEVLTKPFWPLTEEDVASLFQSGRVTPRKLLTRCAERFQDARDIRTVPRFLASAWQKGFEDRRKLNEATHTEEILRHALPMVARIVIPEVTTETDRDFPDISVILNGPNGRIGVSICTHSNMTSLAARLRRLKQQQDLRRLDRLVIMQDDRVPVSQNAKAARERLTALEQGGAKFVHLTVDVLAALDALRALLSDAKSGDLACGAETISPQTVEEWFAEHLSEPLKQLTQDVLGPEKQEDALETDQTPTDQPSYR